MWLGRLLFRLFPVRQAESTRINPTSEELLATADSLPVRPVAIEAHWDGDTDGWRVWLAAVLPYGAGYRSQHLATYKDGGDIRLFNGQVPPWPEAKAAATAGTELATRLGVPFYFPSPDHPEDDCPGWAERHLGYPCRRCGTLLLQRNDPCPWRGACYSCHLDEEREKKESLWSPEERAGPRCSMCGNPAKASRGESWMCPSCLESYDNYQCSRCGGMVTIRKTIPHTDICSCCELRARLDAVPEEQKEAIRAARASGGELSASRVARNLLGWDLYDAMAAVRELSKPTQTPASPSELREK